MDSQSDGNDSDHQAEGVSRREVLKRGALVGAAAWTAPIIHKIRLNPSVAQQPSGLEPTPTPTEVPFACPHPKQTFKTCATWDGDFSRWVWCPPPPVIIVGSEIECAECGEDASFTIGALFGLTISSTPSGELPTFVQVVMPDEVDGQFLPGGASHNVGPAPVCRSADPLPDGAKSVSFGLQGDDVAVVQVELCFEACPCIFARLKADWNGEGWDAVPPSQDPLIVEDIATPFECADCFGLHISSGLTFDVQQDDGGAPTKVVIGLIPEAESGCKIIAGYAKFEGGGCAAGVVAPDGKTFDVGDGSSHIESIEACLICCLTAEELPPEIILSSGLGLSH